MVLIDMEMPKSCSECPFCGLESTGNGMYYDFCEGGKFILCDPDNKVDESCPMKPFTPPAADVVPVVRCRDCKHGHPAEDKYGEYLYCDISGEDNYDPDFYCANGERKGGDE